MLRAKVERQNLTQAADRLRSQVTEVFQELHGASKDAETALKAEDTIKAAVDSILDELLISFFADRAGRTE